MAADASEGEERWQDAVVQVDACAFMVLDRHVDDAQMFRKGCEACLTEMLETGKVVPQEVLMGCTRLRLVARLAKVVKQLGDSPSPDLVRHAASWVRETEEAPSAAAVDGLKEVMDTGYQGPLSAAGLGGNLLAVKIIKACQQINSVLPRLQAATELPEELPKDANEEVIAVSDSQDTQGSQLPGHDRQAEPEVKRRRWRRVSGGSETGASNPELHVVLRLQPSRGGASSPAGQSPEGSKSRPSSDHGPFAAPASRQMPRSLASVPTPTTSALADGDDIFSAPLHSEVVAAQRRLEQGVEPLSSQPAAIRRVRSEAPAPEGDSDVMRDDVPKASGPRERWTEMEEKRLIDGVKRYGQQWSLIRTSCSLRSRTQMQLKDKWRNLKKAGLV